VPRTPRKADQDLRDYPTYTISEAAAYLAIPSRTLYHWVSDDPLWRSAGIEEQTRLLSFRDVAQSYFIDFIRHHVRIPGKKARELLARAKQETGTAYPLAKWKRARTRKRQPKKAAK
jgi:DNA-binding transcriptional MerR regulator